MKCSVLKFSVAEIFWTSDSDGIFHAGKFIIVDA